MGEEVVAGGEEGLVDFSLGMGIFPGSGKGEMNGIVVLEGCDSL